MSESSVRTPTIMPIEKGEDWGTEGALPPGTAEARSDHQIAELVRGGSSHVRPVEGDMARTLGISAGSRDREATTLLPIDAIDVTLDGEDLIAAAHVLIGSRLRPATAVLNAAFVGKRNMAPRAHPGDGRLDVVRFELNVVDWYKAYRRMPTASHLPHPGISTRQTVRWEHSFDRPTRVQLDAATVRSVRQITCTIRRDAIIAGV